MSYNDYGDEPRRPARRATREPAGPAKVQGSTAAAILVFVAIVGFGIGALIGNAGGDDPDTTTTEDQAGAPLGSPDNDQSANPEDTEGEDAEGEDDENSTNAPTDPTAGNGVTISSPEDGGTVPSTEEGRIHIEGTTNPPLADTELIIERSLDNGATWEDAGSGQITVETDGDGSFSTHLWSGRETVNMYRVVSQDGQAQSNTISVNVVSPDESEGDSSGNGDGNGGDDDG